MNGTKNEKGRKGNTVGFLVRDAFVIHFFCMWYGSLLIIGLTDELEYIKAPDNVKSIISDSILIRMFNRS
jgi:hypothetical protein